MSVPNDLSKLGFMYALSFVAAAIAVSPRSALSRGIHGTSWYFCGLALGVVLGRWLWR